VVRCEHSVRLSDEAGELARRQPHRREATRGPAFAEEWKRLGARPGEAQDVLRWLRGQEDEMADLLVRLAQAESPTLDPAAGRRALDLLAGEVEAAGLTTRRVRGQSVADQLYARPRHRRRHEPYQLVLGHYDTVWPVGTRERMPVRVVDDELYGPGGLDMKGGLVQGPRCRRAGPPPAWRTSSPALGARARRRDGARSRASR
jgi:hypothetical protein